MAQRGGAPSSKEKREGDEGDEGGSHPASIGSASLESKG
jgi:hypothetical protein